MKKLSALLLAICLFASCQKYNLWDEEGYKFKHTNLSAMEVLTSAQLWSDNYLERYFFTEPDGKGEQFKPDPELGQIPTGGQLNVIFSVSDDKLRFYYTDSGSIPFLKYYDECPIVEVDKDRIVYTNRVGEELSWKIVKYDEDKILIESDRMGYHFTDTDYPYCRTILHKRTPEDENWEQEYLSFEEYIEKRKQLEEEYYEQKRQREKEYWESASVEEIEKWIEKWLNGGGHTIETIEEYFLYTCPELYESKIKSILDKYR